MFALSIIALVLVAITFGLALAHALEFPGKLRLDEPTYRAVQTIYYPGFTIGGLIGEFGGMFILALMVFLTANDPSRFGWICAALLFLVAGHATYWIVTHPVNAAWLKDTELTGASQVFFSLFSTLDSDWRHMRQVWEWSHVARAVFAFAGFLSLAIACVR